MRRRVTTVVVLLLAGLTFAGCASSQKRAFRSLEKKHHSAVTPVPQTADWAAKWWRPRHESVCAKLAGEDTDLLFIGDSITHGWENAGKEIWEQYYAPRNAVNMGFGGDRTQHVLWRLDHCEFAVRPKLAIVMIGTNNSNRKDNTAEEIADGIIAVCHRLREHLPQTKILLLAIFPRNPLPDPQREKNAKASRLASRIADGKTVYYMDIGEKFLTQKGILTQKIMPDYLHPNAVGYQIWAEAIEAQVAELMGERG